MLHEFVRAVPRHPEVGDLEDALFAFDWFGDTGRQIHQDLTADAWAHDTPVGQVARHRVALGGLEVRVR